jgi:MFS family permease
MLDRSLLTSVPRLFAFIDRSNIGNAKIVGLPEELGISTGTKFNVALLVFYIPYILIDVPSNWIVKHFKAGIYLPALITAWGLVSTFVGFTRSFAGLIVARLLLGLFEGGLLGGILVYLAMFYRRHEMVRRIGYFYCAAPLSGAFGGLIATGLAKIHYGGYNRWHWIFFSMSGRMQLSLCSFSTCTDTSRLQSRVLRRLCLASCASSSCHIRLRMLSF